MLNDQNVIRRTQGRREPTPKTCPVTYNGNTTDKNYFKKKQTNSNIVNGTGKMAL